MTFAKVGLFAALAGFIAGSIEAAAEPVKTLAEGPVVPILAWAGVPGNADPERYAELADAGFTHNFSSGGNADAMQKVLDTAHAHGLKQLISIGELESDPEGTARRFKDHPANGGYYLRDEPGAGLFPQLAKWAKRIQSVDTKNPCYVNLFPTYGNPDQWETPDYQTYLDRFVAEVPVPMLSFDHYCVIGEDGKESGHYVRPDYYHNLEMCAVTARKANRPLWAFALATAHNPYPIPTVAALRLQVFSNLAYGAQVIQYFTYWTLPSNVWNFHEGPIGVDGKRTATYDRVRQVNAELQALRGAFVGSKVLSVGHTGDAIPAGTTRFTSAAPLLSMTTRGTGAVVSKLARGEHRFLVIVNRDLQKPMGLAAEFDRMAGVQTLAARDGSLKPLAGAFDAEIEPGGVAIFAWAAK